MLLPTVISTGITLKKCPRSIPGFPPAIYLIILLLILPVVTLENLPKIRRGVLQRKHTKLFDDIRKGAFPHMIFPGVPKLFFGYSSSQFCMH